VGGFSAVERVRQGEVPSFSPVDPTGCSIDRFHGKQVCPSSNRRERTDEKAVSQLPAEGSGEPLLIQS
jgi:hypothetical protein